MPTADAKRGKTLPDVAFTTATWNCLRYTFTCKQNCSITYDTETTAIGLRYNTINFYGFVLNSKCCIHDPRFHKRINYCTNAIT